MKIKTVAYSKVFPLGNYSNEKLSVEIELSETDNASECIKKARQLVELSCSKGKENLNTAYAIIAQPSQYRGVEVESAKELVKVYEELAKEGFALLEAENQS